MDEKMKGIEFQFMLRTHTHCGAGQASNIDQHLHNLGLSNPGIIVDAGISRQTYIRSILTAIEQDRSFSPIIWEYNLGTEPDYDSLDRVKTIFLDEQGAVLTDCFIGIGGGSAIDFAKGLATVVVNPGAARRYKGFPKNLKPSLPIIAIPTTAGTGSEVTFNAVFTDHMEKRKLGINTINNFPILAILDPLLTLTCPQSVTSSSGMDALVHTIESHSAIQSTPMSRIFSREAFRHVYNGLVSVASMPDDLESRSKIQFGAYLAGIALMNSGSGPAGALSYPLGVHFKVPHGTAGGVFLPYIVYHNVMNGYDYSELYDLMEGADTTLPITEKNTEFADKIFHLADMLSIPHNLHVFGVSSDNIDILIAETDSLEKAFEQNPVPFTVEDGKRLLRYLVENSE